MAKTKQIFGQGIFNLAMKATVYGQFVAGEDKDKIKVDKIFDSKMPFLHFFSHNLWPISRRDSVFLAFRRGSATSIWSKKSSIYPASL